MATEALGARRAARRRDAAAPARAAAAFAVPFAAAAGRVLRVVRPVGWVLIGAAAALWVSGGVLGWQELTIAAVVITTTLALSALFLIGRSTYAVTLDLGRTRVVVGDRAVGALTLTNEGSRAILPSTVVLPVGPGRGEFAVKRLPAGESIEELFAIPTLRRGVLPVGPVSVVRGDALGLFERIQSRGTAIDLYVHPRTVLFAGQSLGFVRDLEGMAATDLSRDDVSFHALREYVPGDDLRHVHWRSTARTGQLMMRQYEETRRSHFAIGLSRNPADYRDPEEFELAISAAGSLGLRALLDSRRVDVHVQGATIPAQTGKQFLDGLSALQPSRPRQGSIDDLASSVVASVPLAAVVVLIAGSAVDAARLRAACARAPQGARVLALVADLGAEPSLRRLGEADVVTVGALEQLPLALSKVLA